LASVEVVNEAEDPAKVAVPKLVLPSRKVTVPVRVPAPGAVTETVAVKVTACPTSAGFTEDTSAAVVVALFTVWVRAVEVLVTKLALPP